jgi:hypothetical protein
MAEVKGGGDGVGRALAETRRSLSGLPDSICGRVLLMHDGNQCGKSCARARLTVCLVVVQVVKALERYSTWIIRQ